MALWTRLNFTLDSITRTPSSFPQHEVFPTQPAIQAEERQAFVVSSPFFEVKGAAASFKLNPASLPLTTLHSWRKWNRKAMSVKPTVHTDGTWLSTIHLFASPVQLFLSKAEVFSAFFNFSLSILGSHQHKVCQTCLQRKLSEACHPRAIRSVQWPRLSQ